MQYFDRKSVPPPALFRSPQARRAREALQQYLALAQKELRQTRPEGLDLNLDEDASVRQALDQLFHGKCAFCESTGWATVHRFRPVGEALPVEEISTSHLYYLWLGNAWENLYPVCHDCAALARPAMFPLAGRRAPLPTPRDLAAYVKAGDGRWPSYPLKESPVFLDPCADMDLSAHLEVQANGVATPLSERALETSLQYNLLRPDLIRRRRLAFEGYFDRLLSALHPESREYDAAPFQFDELEFGGSWYLLVRRLAMRRLPAATQSLGKTRIGPLLFRNHRSFRQWKALRDLVTNMRESAVPFEQPAPQPSPPKLPPAIRPVVVELANYKSLERLRLEMPPAPRAADSARAPALLILGENAAGKSSLLEALALALCGPAVREGLVETPGDIPMKPGLMGGSKAKAPPAATVSVLFEDDSRHTTRRELRVSADGFVDTGDWQDHPPLVFAYGAFRQYIREDFDHHPLITLFRSERILPNPETWLLGLEEDAFDFVVRTLRDVLSIDGKFRVMRREPEPAPGRCVMELRTADGKSSDMPLRDASSGYRTVLAMVCDILRGLMVAYPSEAFSPRTARATVLIDEIEAHLHPRLKMRIMDGLRKAFPGLSFIVTTHDPLCLRGMEDGEVVVLQRVARQASHTRSRMPVLVEQLVQLPDINQLTIEQLLTSDFFSLFTTDAPGIEQEFARTGDLLALGTPPESGDWPELDRQIAETLPIGSTHIQRLLQSVLRDYLKERRGASADRIGALREEVRAEVLGILRQA